MVLDLTQVVVSAVTTAIVSSFSTTTTIILMRYFPKVLDSVEKSVKKEQDGDKAGR
jgi:hypothetical protein